MLLRTSMYLGVFLTLLGFEACTFSSSSKTTHRFTETWEIAPARDTTITVSAVIPRDTVDSIPNDPVIAFESMDHLEYKDIVWNQQRIARKETLVYDGKNPEQATVIDTLKSGDEVTVLGYMNIYDTLLQQVSYRDKEGFIALSNVYLFSGRYSDLNTDFKVHTTEVKMLESRYIGPEIKLLAFETGTENEIAGIDLEMYSHGFRMMNTFNCALPKVQALINLSRYRESCPGGVSNTFVAYQDGHFEELLTARTSREMGMHEDQLLYIPMRFEDGSIKLVHDGVPVTHEPAGSSQRYKVFEKPDSIDVPIHQLLVLEEETADAIWNDELGDYEMEENGSFKTEITFYKVTYYRWNGTKLEPLL